MTGTPPFHCISRGGDHWWFTAKDFALAAYIAAATSHHFVSGNSVKISRVDDHCRFTAKTCDSSGVEWKSRVCLGPALSTLAVSLGLQPSGKPPSPAHVVLKSPEIRQTEPLWSHPRIGTCHLFRFQDSQPEITLSVEK